MKSGKVALLITRESKEAELIGALSDFDEINILESSLKVGDPDPTGVINTIREKRRLEDEEFGDYVEELLCQPFLQPDIRDHGVQWLRSKIKIQEFHRSEVQATQIIAEYAFKIFQEDQSKQEFLLAGPTSVVKIKVYEVPQKSSPLEEDAQQFAA